MRIPNSTPFLHMAVTMVPSVTCLAASMTALPVAIMIFRKNWSVSARNLMTSYRSFSSISILVITGLTSFRKARDAAIFLWWNSSPMAIALATRGFTFSPPMERMALPRVGPSTSFIHSRRSTTSLEYAPNLSTLPIPSFMVQYASLPSVWFSTTNTGMLAEVMPPMGPTAFT